MDFGWESSQIRSRTFAARSVQMLFVTASGLEVVIEAIAGFGFLTFFRRIRGRAGALTSESRQRLDSHCHSDFCAENLRLSCILLGPPLYRLVSGGTHVCLERNFLSCVHIAGSILKSDPSTGCCKSWIRGVGIVRSGSYRRLQYSITRTLLSW